MKLTMRKKSIFLDCWYMACNRVIIMTCMICQLLGQYHWGIAADSNSPPSMENTTKPVQSVTKPMIRPENSVKDWQKVRKCSMHSQLM
jgi:hypothetical protein